MKKDNCIKIIDSIQTCVEEMLEAYIRGGTNRDREKWLLRATFLCPCLALYLG